MNFDYLNALNVPLTKDIPMFVTWNWPVIRKAAFIVFLSGIFGMLAFVVAMIYSLPTVCNPDTTWYQGSVFYEIFPASFKDTNVKNGIGNLQGIASQVKYFQDLSVGAIHLNSIFPTNNYPENFKEIELTEHLMQIAKELGNFSDFQNLVAVLHEGNIQLILDLPLYPLYQKLEPTLSDNLTEFNDLRRIERSMIDNNGITNVMRFWLSQGVDGFYLKGLENFADDPYLMENIREWKFVLGADRIMIVNQTLIHRVTNSVADEILEKLDLVDVHLDITNGTQSIQAQIKTTMNGKLQ